MVYGFFVFSHITTRTAAARTMTHMTKMVNVFRPSSVFRLPSFKIVKFRLVGVPSGLVSLISSIIVSFSNSIIGVTLRYVVFVWLMFRLTDVSLNFTVQFSGVFLTIKLRVVFPLPLLVIFTGINVVLLGGIFILLVVFTDIFGV